MTTRRTLCAVALLALALGATGCPQRTTIRAVLSDPGHYRNRDVAIGGRVTNAYGALGRGIYEIDDGTGRMWVYTERYGVPGRNAQIGVSGRIVDGFSYAGSTYGTVLHETDRRTQGPGSAPARLRRTP